MLSCIFLFFMQHVEAQQEEDSVNVTDSIKTDAPTETDYQQELEKKKEQTWFLQKPIDAGNDLTIRQRKIPDSIMNRMKADKNFWYANAELEKKKEEEERNGGFQIPIIQRSWFQTLIWFIIIGGFAVFLMIYLGSKDVGLFRRKNKLTTTGADEVATEDIFAINYQKEIEKAAAQGNYRLAVRLMFLRLLKNMSEKNIIRYQQDTTNFEYLQQLHTTPYYHNFFRITRNYEYSWYGKFDVSETAYSIIRNDFVHLEKELEKP